MTPDQYVWVGRITRAVVFFLTTLVVAVGVAFSSGFYLSAIVKLFLAGWRLAWRL